MYLVLPSFVFPLNYKKLLYPLAISQSCYFGLQIVCRVPNFELTFIIVNFSVDSLLTANWIKFIFKTQCLNEIPYWASIYCFTVKNNCASYLLLPIRTLILERNVKTLDWKFQNEENFYYRKFSYYYLKLFTLWECTDLSLFYAKNIYSGKLSLI